MALQLVEFWRLFQDSRLLTAEQFDYLKAEYERQQGGGGNVASLIPWLIAQNGLTEYQSKVLLAGRSGPFHYGDYRVYDRLASGRFAGCFRAIHGPTNHLVVLQFVTGPAAHDPDLWARVRLHAWAHVGLPHAELSRVHEVVDLLAYKFAVCEDLPGESLAGRLPLPPAEACRVAYSAALALGAMAAARLAHGAVSPRNLWLEPNGHVKLLRDPLAPPAAPARMAPEAWLIQSDYAAPELARPDQAPNELSDIYALGCALYHMLTGYPPFPGGEPNAKLERHAREPAQPLEPRGVPPIIAQLVMYMMAKNPAVRYQRFGDVAERLRTFVHPAHLQIPALPPPPSLAGYEQYLARQAPAALGAADMAARAAGGPALAGSPPPPPLAGSPPPPPVAGAPLAGSPPASAAFGPLGDGEQSLILNQPLAAARLGLNPASPGVADAPPAAMVGAPPNIAAAPAANHPIGLVVAASDEPRKGFSAALTKKNNLVVWGGALGGVALCALALLVLVAGGGGDDAPATDATAAAPATDGTGGDEGAPDAAPPTTPVKHANTGVVDKTKPGAAVALLDQDDGVSPWSSPTSGAPLDLRYVPPGAEVLIHWRVADMLAHAEGQRVVQSLGPDFQTQRKNWEAASGFNFDELAELTCGIHNTGGSAPKFSFVARLKEKVAREQLLQRWGDPEASALGVFNARGWSFFVPTGDVGVFLMAAPELAPEVAKNPGAPPLFRREVAALLQRGDAARHCTVLFVPNYLFNEQGQYLFSGARAKALPALSWFLGDGLKAGLASLHFGDDFYVELRFVGDADRNPHALGQQLRERLRQTPAAIENYFVLLNPPMYWKKLAGRYPGMIAYMHDQTRVGVEKPDTLVNARLPLQAAHNLMLGGELALASTPGQATVAAVAADKPKLNTIEEVLAARMSISFEQDSLEFAMQNIANEVNGMKPGFEFKIRILGDDLKIEGITRNQSVRMFNQQNQPVADIVTALCMKANPVTTVKAPKEEDQKLLWIVAPDPDAQGQKMVFVTTRKAAAERSQTLPEVFRP